MQPTAHTSMEVEYTWFSTSSSGARYQRVTTYSVSPRSFASASLCTGAGAALSRQNRDLHQELKEMLLGYFFLWRAQVQKAAPGGTDQARGRPAAVVCRRPFCVATLFGCRDTDFEGNDWKPLGK